MKNTTKILAVTLATAIIATGISSTYAMNGQGGGQGGGMGKNLTTEQRAEIQNMSETERQAYMQTLKNSSSDTVKVNGKTKGQGQSQGKGNGQEKGNSGSGSKVKHSGNPADMIKDIALSDLSEQEKLDLAYQYSEEMVARDAYNYFYTLYGVQTFKNIADSEAEHMAAVKVLLDRYSLPTPTNYGELQDEFDALKTEGEKGLKEALEVGLKIEMLDIEDIKDTIKSTDNDDIKIVFTNIGGASYNHLRGFAKGLANNNLTTSIDYSAYLSLEQVNSKGTLKYLLAEDLASEGVVLPSQASAKNIQANCEKQEANQKIREGYKQEIDKKYGKQLKKLDKEKLQKVAVKIDSAIEKVENNTGMTDKIKEKTLNVYYALKDYLSGLFIR